MKIICHNINLFSIIFCSARTPLLFIVKFDFWNNTVEEVFWPFWENEKASLPRLLLLSWCIVAYKTSLFMSLFIISEYGLAHRQKKHCIRNPFKKNYCDQTKKIKYEFNQHIVCYALIAQYNRSRNISTEGEVI